MDQCEDREEGAPASKTTLCGEHESQNKALRYQPEPDKTSRRLHIMCHISVFCWITATVLEDVLNAREGGLLPKTLTEMYIHFLVVQAKVKVVKYEGGAEADSHWSPESRKMIKSLEKLGFDQLQKGNLIFYES